MNVFVLSKLWYVSSVLPPPLHYIKVVERAVFEFLWLGKAEFLKRSTMYLPPKEGGVGIVCIHAKVQSLLLMQVFKVYQNTNAPWVGFGHMWLGLALRKHAGYVFRNNQPHCLEGAPPFYVACRKSLLALSKAEWQFGVMWLSYSGQSFQPCHHFQSRH